MDSDEYRTYSWVNYFTKDISDEPGNEFTQSNLKYRANLSIQSSWLIATMIVLYFVIGKFIGLEYDSITTYL